MEGLTRERIVQDTGNTRGEVGSVGLKFAGVQCFFEGKTVFAVFLDIVKHGIGLIAVGDDIGVTELQIRIVND